MDFGANGNHPLGLLLWSTQEPSQMRSDTACVVLALGPRQLPAADQCFSLALPGLQPPCGCSRQSPEPGGGPPEPRVFLLWVSHLERPLSKLFSLPPHICTQWGNLDLARGCKQSWGGGGDAHMQ